MTQPNPALKEALQNSLAALKMIEGSFFEGSPEQRAIETALHSIEESSALQRETGGEKLDKCKPTGRRYSSVSEMMKGEGFSQETIDNVKRLAESKINAIAFHCDNRHVVEYEDAFEIEQELMKVIASLSLELGQHKVRIDNITESHNALHTQLSQLRAANGEKSPRIYTKCPACHNDTLTINEDKHLLCTWIDCPYPTLIDNHEMYSAQRSQLTSLTQQLADAKGRLAWKERDGKCSICGKLTNAISAGIPDLWPLVFPKPGETEDSFWHAGCVRNALHERDELKARLEEAEKERDKLRSAYEQTLRAVAHLNPSK